MQTSSSCSIAHLWLLKAYIMHEIRELYTLEQMIFLLPQLFSDNLFVLPSEIIYNFFLSVFLRFFASYKGFLFKIHYIVKLHFLSLIIHYIYPAWVTAIMQHHYSAHYSSFLKVHVFRCMDLSPAIFKQYFARGLTKDQKSEITSERFLTCQLGNTKVFWLIKKFSFFDLIRYMWLEKHLNPSILQ